MECQRLNNGMCGAFVCLLQTEFPIAAADSHHNQDASPPHRLKSWHIHHPQEQGSLWQGARSIAPSAIDVAGLACAIRNQFHLTTADEQHILVVQIEEALIAIESWKALNVKYIA